MTLVKLSILACFRYATQAKIVRANTRRRRCGIRATAAAHGESGALSAPPHETLDVLVDRMIADIVGRAHLLELYVAPDGDVQIGRAWCRASVGQAVQISVVAVSAKKQ